MSERKKHGTGAYGMVNVHYFKMDSEKGNPRRDLEQEVWYTALGRDTPNGEQRGHIYNPDGEIERYGEYKAWALGTSRHVPYMYRAHLSLKHHILEDEDFVEIMRNANEAHEMAADFRLIIHDETAHRHAHVLFPADKTMSKQVLRDWSGTIRDEVERLEQVRCIEKQLPLPRVGESADLYQYRTELWREAVADGALERDDVDYDPPKWSPLLGRIDEDELERTVTPQPRQKQSRRQQLKQAKYKVKEIEIEDDLDLDW